MSMRKAFHTAMLLWLVCQLFVQPVHAQWAQMFSRVPAFSATPAQREAALFFRTVHFEKDAKTAPLVSLNPADASLPPAILDSEKGTLLALQVPGGLMDGIQIVRLLELGAFHGRFAAAKAVIRESTIMREAWGYVDRAGRWVIAPRYDMAESPVNRWGKVGVGQAENSRLIQARYIIDLESRKPVNLPDGRRPRYDALVPVGPHVAFALLAANARDDGSPSTPYLLSATNGSVMPLPSYPSPQAESNGMLFLDGQRIFEISTGRIIESPPAQYSYNWVLPGVAIAQNQVGDRLEIQVFKPATQTTLAENLRAAAALTKDFFVACDQGDNLAPVIRRELEQPYPFDSDSKLRCGLMDAQGKWRVPSRFQHFDVLADGTVVMRGAHEWCVLEPQSSSAPVCSEKVPPAMLRAGLWLDVESGPVDTVNNSRHLYGYRDGNSLLVIPYQFDYASPFVGQIANVNLLGQQGIIDARGHWLTPEPASHVVQRVLEANARTPGTPCEQCFGLINRVGRWIWPPVFNMARPAGQPDRFWVRGHGDNPWLETDAQGRSRYAPASLNQRNEEVQPSIQLLPNRIVATSLNGLWGLTDTDGAWLVPARFLAMDVISDNRAIAKSKEGLGLINAKGTWLVKPQFARMEALNDGLITACNDASGCQTMDANGVRIDMPDELGAAEPFDAQGLAAAQIRATGLWGFINRKGHWQIEPKFAKVHSFLGQYALVQADRSVGVAHTRNIGPGSPYLVGAVGLIPKAKLAWVSVVPSAAIEEAQSRDWYWGSKQQNQALVGLMDAQGQWLLPNAARWPTASR